MTKGTARTTGYRVGKVIRLTNRYFDWGQSDPEPQAGRSTMIPDWSTWDEETTPRTSGHGQAGPHGLPSGSKIAAAKTAPIDSAFVLPDAAQSESGPVRAWTSILSGPSGPHQEAEHQLATSNAGPVWDHLDHRLPADWMPAGAGLCPVCDRVAWLRASSTDTPCDTCAALLVDEGEAGLHGRPLP